MFLYLSQIDDPGKYKKVLSELFEHAPICKKKKSNNGVNIDIVNKCTCLRVVFTTGGSFSETHDALAARL